ncbi:MAG TPA: tetratricopeptide repeat protein, partial [Polyangia bacterium]
LPPGPQRALLEALGPPVPLATFTATKTDLDSFDLFLVASTNHGPPNLARAAAAGIPRLALLRFGFAPPDLTSFALDWVLRRHPDAVFVLSENARAEVWDALDGAPRARVFTAALWSFVAAPLSCDAPWLEGPARDPITTLERLAAEPAFAGLLRPPHRAEAPPSTPPPPELEPLLQSFFSRVVVPVWAHEARGLLRVWADSIARLSVSRDATPDRVPLLVHPVRTARHLGDHELATALLQPAESHEPPHPALALEAAGVLLDQGRCAEALTALEACRARAPRDPGNELDDAAYLLAGTALALQRTSGRPLTSDQGGLVERLQAAAARARTRAETTAEELPGRLATIGFGIVRGALDPDTVAALFGLYREIFVRLDETGRAALAMGSAITSAQAELVHEGLRRAGVLAAITEALGGDVRFIADGSFNRHRRGVPARGLCVYHQDGRIGNRLTREVTCWVPLLACGRHAPGVELIARRFRGFFPLGDGHPSAKRVTDLLPNDLVVPGTTITPAFEPGDVLVFDKFTPHRTQPLTADDLHDDGERFSMDLRWYSDRQL